MGLSTLVKVTPELAVILGKDETTRPEATKLLWDYIKKNNLQDPQNKRTIVPDEALSKVLGIAPINMMKMAGLLNKHFTKS